ncbi:MAG: alanine racemase [Actinomycetota bacterium]|nr:alanine racemase [Actinomycetota bacterium]
MFLELIKERNPNLIKAGVYFHQSGLIPPNTFILDADNIEKNVNFIRQEARKWNLSIYFMLKQIRNPQVSEFILDKNKKETVCVDTNDARVIWGSGNLIGHVGHLVQIPDKEIREIILMQPEVVTVFSVEKAKRLSEEASRLGMIQDILLRVTGKDDINYPSMEGGIEENNLERVADEIKEYNNVRIIGVTNFPTMYHSNKGFSETTPNLETEVRCAEKLKKMGFPISQINAPGNSCTFSMEAYAKGGATHIEPGHGITGTTPFSVSHSLPEVPAMIYVTEVLHFHNKIAYINGGGLYWEDYVAMGKDFKNKVLVGNNEDNIFDGKCKFIGAGPEGKEIFIDYHGLLDPGEKKVRIGDTVIFGFRSQSFATRCANTAVVRGVNDGNYVLMGVYDHCCHRLQRLP